MKKKRGEREREKRISRWPNVDGRERRIYSTWKDFLPIDWERKRKRQ